MRLQVSPIPTGHQGTIGGPGEPPIAQPLADLCDNQLQLSTRRPKLEEPVLETDRISPPLAPLLRRGVPPPPTPRRT